MFKILRKIHWGATAFAPTTLESEAGDPTTRPPVPVHYFTILKHNVKISIDYQFVIGIHGDLQMSPNESCSNRLITPPRPAPPRPI